MEFNDRRGEVRAASRRRGVKLSTGTTHKIASRMEQMAERPHTFEVDWAHDKDSLKAGNLKDGTSRVNVLARNETEGSRLAQQMVAARGKEPTDARWVP